MIELAVSPHHRVMAGFACRGETRLRVRRVLRLVVILLVTRNAGSLVQVVIVVDVAIAALAWWNGVRSGQREPGLVVIELRRRPARCVMADFTGLREAL